MFNLRIPALWEAIAVFVGTVIGSGVFLLPYAAIQSGIFISNIWLIALSFLLLIVHLAFGEVVLRTNNICSLAGYTGKYLSKSAQKFIFISSLVTLTFSSMVYLLLAAQFLGALLPANFLSFNILFGICWAVFSICSCINLSHISKFNLLLTIGEVGFICVIACYVFPYMNLGNLQNFLFKSDWLMSYGVIFYALNGLAAVPLVFSLLREKKAKPVSFKKVIIVGSIIVSVAYLLFMNCIALVSGGKTTQDAISGLVYFVGKPIVILGAVAGILIVWTSFIAFAQYLKTLLHNDFGWNNIISTLTVIFLPLLFLFIGINGIGDLISLMGGVAGGLDGLIVFLVYMKAKQKPEKEPEYKLNLKPAIIWIIAGFFFVSSILQIIVKALQ